METIELGRWLFYCHQKLMYIPYCGRWMYTFHDRTTAARICGDIVERHIAVEAKHSNGDTGICCFYIDGRDLDAHKRVIGYMMAHGLINKTPDGSITNTQFKFDEQARIEQDKQGVNTVIRISDFVDLKTGLFLPDEIIKKKEIFA